VNDRKLLGLLALAKAGASEGERAAARNALRDYIGIVSETDHECDRSTAQAQAAEIVDLKRQVAVGQHRLAALADLKSRVATIPTPRPPITWRQPALQLGAFMTLTIYAVSTANASFWTLALAVLVVSWWKPQA
jgi:hypothetical protein